MIKTINIESYYNRWYKWNKNPHRFRLRKGKQHSCINCVWYKIKEYYTCKINYENPHYYEKKDCFQNSIQLELF